MGMDLHDLVKKSDPVTTKNSASRDLSNRCTLDSHPGFEMTTSAGGITSIKDEECTLCVQGNIDK